MPRFVVIPESATIMVATPEGPKPAIAHFEQLLMEGWTASPAFVANLAAIEQGQRIRKAFRDKPSGAVVILDEEDWKALENVVRNEGRINPSLVPLLYEARPEMWTCITQATQTDPRETT
jgi:hypothetical protein